MGISMVQVALLESRFRGDSLHSGAWCLRLAAQAAAIRAPRIIAQAGHNLALHELKQIRCTGRADSTPGYLDLRPPPETFDRFLKKMSISPETFATFHYLAVYLSLYMNL